MVIFKDVFLIVALQKCNDPLFVPPPVQDVSVSFLHLTKLSKNSSNIGFFRRTVEEDIDVPDHAPWRLS